MDHLRSAIEQVPPSDVESYEELTEKFQRLVSTATRKDDFVPESAATGLSSVPNR